MLRLKGLRSVVLWGALSIAALANLVFASSLSATGTYDDFNLVSIIVVAVAGTLLVGTLCYQCRSCCCCCCRRQRSVVKQPVVAVSPTRDGGASDGGKGDDASLAAQPLRAADPYSPAGPPAQQQPTAV